MSLVNIYIQSWQEVLSIISFLGPPVRMQFPLVKFFSAATMENTNMNGHFKENTQVTVTCVSKSDNNNAFDITSIHSLLCNFASFMFLPDRFF